MDPFSTKTNLNDDNIESIYNKHNSINKEKKTNKTGTFFFFSYSLNEDEIINLRYIKEYIRVLVSVMHWVPLQVPDTLYKQSIFRPKYLHFGKILLMGMGIKILTSYI